MRVKKIGHFQVNFSGESVLALFSCNEASFTRDCFQNGSGFGELFGGVFVMSQFNHKMFISVILVYIVFMFFIVRF